MTTSNAPRSSSFRFLLVGFGMELSCYVVGMLGSYFTAGWIDAVSAALGIGGFLVLVVGAGKVAYDVMQLMRGRSPRDAVRNRVGPLQIRLSTLANVALGGAMAGSYFLLCAYHVAGFGENGDIGGGGLLIGGCIVGAIGAAKLVYDLVGHRARGVEAVRPPVV